MRLASYSELLERSVEVDEKWSSKDLNIDNPEPISFSIPESHPRYQTLTEYQVSVGSVESILSSKEGILFVDEVVAPLLSEYIGRVEHHFVLNPVESQLKTLSYLREFAKELPSDQERIIAIGGGIVLNCAAYIAEQLGIDLILVPTTVLSMSDASVGGKVRVNSVENGIYIKHAYKNFYEPSLVVIDPKFLTSLSTDQIQIGLAEVIKHAIYQSPKLAAYLLSDEFDPFSNRKSLLKAVLWTIELKRVSLAGDPNEEAGGQMILRAAHDVSDRLEEQSKFTLSHGEAVLKAMAMDVKDNSEREPVLKKIYEKLDLSFKD